ncbi:hypothetical protein FALB51S_01885 [Frigidibacter albus]
MHYHEHNIESGLGKKFPSPQCCIYCDATDVELTDEHVVPYALGANAQVLLKSCCKTCQGIIQPYEQRVLRNQLGDFRAQIGAPTRRKKARRKEIVYDFVELDTSGTFIRNLQSLSVPIAEAPVALHLWASPPPRISLIGSFNVGIGRLWSYCEEDALKAMSRRVGKETGAKHVAVRTGDINREDYLRSLAKTGHAFACAVLGPGAFEPLLLDVILCRSDDVSMYVGDLPEPETIVENPAHTLQIFLGVPEVGPVAGYIVVRIQLYPGFSSPVHIIVVGRPNSLTQSRLDAIPLTLELAPTS